MKLERIFEEWGKDSDYDKTELGDEALKTSKLHHKYYMILSAERMTKKQLEAEMKVLRPAETGAVSATLSANKKQITLYTPAI